LTYAVGGLADVEHGEAEVAEGLAGLADAREIADAGIGAVAVGAGDVALGAGKLQVAERGGELADLAALGGIEELGRAGDTQELAEDLEGLTQIVRTMGGVQLGRGLAIARVSGELSAVSRVMTVLDMPLLAAFLDDRSSQLQVL